MFPDWDEMNLFEKIFMVAFLVALALVPIVGIGTVIYLMFTE